MAVTIWTTNRTPTTVAVARPGQQDPACGGSGLGRCSWLVMACPSDGRRERSENSFLTALGCLSSDGSTNAVRLSRVEPRHFRQRPPAEAGARGPEAAPRSPTGRPLNRDRTLRAALAVADQRRDPGRGHRCAALARELGDRGRLALPPRRGQGARPLDGLVDLVAAEIEPPDGVRGLAARPSPERAHDTRCGPAPPPLGRQPDGVADEPGAGDATAPGDRDPVLPRGWVLGPPGCPCDLGGRQLRARLRSARGQPALPRRVGAGSHDRSHHGGVPSLRVPLPVRDDGPVRPSAGLRLRQGVRLRTLPFVLDGVAPLLEP